MPVSGFIREFRRKNYSATGRRFSVSISRVCLKAWN